MRVLLAFLALVSLIACAPQGVAAGSRLRCDLGYTLTVGPILMESRAQVSLALDTVARRWRVTALTVTDPWDGPDGIQPWSLFIVGRELELARVRADSITLFENRDGAFTINRRTGDAGWSREGPAGESEYSGGCRG